MEFHKCSICDHKIRSLFITSQGNFVSIETIAKYTSSIDDVYAGTSCMHAPIESSDREKWRWSLGHDEVYILPLRNRIGQYHSRYNWEKCQADDKVG